MLTSYFLILFVLLLLTITGFKLTTTNNDWISMPSMILGICSVVIFVIFGFAAGFGGECGFNTYKEYTTTDFTKALATDHSSVTIIHNGTPFIFKDYDVVHNFHSISNLLIWERTSVLGCKADGGMKIVTPKNTDDALLDNAEN